MPAEQVAWYLTHGGATDTCWTDERDRLLIEAADALPDSADIGEILWPRLARLFSEEQLLDLLVLARGICTRPGSMTPT